MPRSFTLMRPFGIQVQVHWSWALLAVLVASSLATGWFPVLSPGYDSSAYWMAGAIGALGLFSSILLHELSHALVGRHYKMKMEKITLFLFGGVAHLEDEPRKPKEEFLMAAAGPALSLGLAFFLHALLLPLSLIGSSDLLLGLVSYLASINLVVAVFNLLPGFPLDGGRILRAALWQLKGDLLWATRIAASIGQFFGGALIVLAFVSLIAGNGISALWSMLLGFLLIAFARASYSRLVIKHSLGGKPAEHFMNPQPPTIPSDLSLEDFTRQHLLQKSDSLFPVVDERGEFVGCIDAAAVSRVPERQWALKTVGQIRFDCRSDRQIAPETDAVVALSRMAEKGYRELLVVQGERLMGVLTRHALLRYLSLRES